MAVGIPVALMTFYLVHLDHYAILRSPDPIGGENHRPRLHIGWDFNQSIRDNVRSGNSAMVNYRQLNSQIP
jgi:hypothetical protein